MPKKCYNYFEDYPWEAIISFNNQLLSREGPVNEQKFEFLTSPKIEKKRADTRLFETQETQEQT